jgi:hypothetical protein
MSVSSTSSIIGGVTSVEDLDLCSNEANPSQTQVLGPKGKEYLATPMGQLRQGELGV